MELTIFLDDGGVMNDNRVRGAQWPDLLGEFLAPILGSTPEAWAEANRAVASSLWGGLQAELRRDCRDFEDFQRRYDLAWLGGMCGHVGVEPPSEAEALHLTERANRHVTPRIRAALPGAIPAVADLRARGITLHTASGESSLELAGYLEGMGVLGHFGHLFGPDLVGYWKEGSAYYARIFASAGVDPAAALVADDSPDAVRWALQAGAQAVLVGAGPEHTPPGARAIAALADLPGLLG